MHIAVLLSLAELEEILHVLLVLLVRLPLDWQKLLRKIDFILCLGNWRSSKRLKELVQPFNVAAVLLNLHVCALKDAAHIFKQFFGVLLEGGKLSIKICPLMADGLINVLLQWLLTVALSELWLDACQLKVNFGTLVFATNMPALNLVDPSLEPKHFALNLIDQASLKFFYLFWDSICQCSQSLFENTCLVLDDVESLGIRDHIGSQVFVVGCAFALNLNLFVLKCLDCIMQLEDFVFQWESLDTSSQIGCSCCSHIPGLHGSSTLLLGGGPRIRIVRGLCEHSGL